MSAFVDLDKTSAWKAIRGLPAPRALSLIMDSRPAASASIAMGGGLTYNYGAKRVEEAAIDALQALANETDLIGKYRMILSGEYMNTGEKRRVLHHLTRGQQAGAVVHEGKDLREFYESERKRIEDFCARVHSGQVTGSTGKTFSTVCQVGIGGSDLGPRALYLALAEWVRERGSLKMKAEFISNVDPDDANAVMARVDCERTLFILVSKSGTTQETLANEIFVRSILKERGLNPDRHMLAVTSETSPLARNPRYLESFYIDDFIGGRYSSTSAVGGAILSLAFGPAVFKQILDGAAEADALALEPDCRKNAALMDALIGVYERNVMLWPATCVLPYSQALSRFPAHLQQMDMESNGKTVNRDGKPVSYPTGPIIFGEPGTNGQHSFYQLLHQGSDIVPLQFIGFRRAQTTKDVEVEGSTSQRKLNANLAAQIVAFARGSSNPDPNKDFKGGRPSSLIHGDSLTPAALGALLAHYENKVMFQGFVWNLNSFDQEGVQLGKVLTKRVLSGAGMDASLASYASILGV